MSCCLAGPSAWLFAASAPRRADIDVSSSQCSAVSSPGMRGRLHDFSSISHHTPETIEAVASQSPPLRFVAIVGVLDDLTLFGFCYPSVIARLRAAAPVLGGVQGLLLSAAMSRLARHHLTTKSMSPVADSHASLHTAAETGDVEAVWCHLFLGKSPNVYDMFGCVPLHYASIRHMKVCKLLLRAKADVTLKHDDLNMRAGWTPLHFAAYSGAQRIVLLLLSSGAKVNQMDVCRRTPLFYARDRGHACCCRLLEKFGGTADTHLIEDHHLVEAMTYNDGFSSIPDRGHAVLANSHSRQRHRLEQWDASADAADMYAEGAMPSVQFPESSDVGQ
eukprot:TRINITY_DN57621_c0_g1_i1.p1 TRINITY_DN57621_c0_g1~~TRINITY_DN57621_c0_g1_i1.p1  ORF type:complete len:347 (-),score=31.98 TRINITY_DN57621_c0_g1_i1:381-1379(-)